MKTFKRILLLVCISLSVLACKKDDEGGDDPAGGTGSFTAQVDGQSFEGISGTVVAQVSASGNGEAIAISGGTNASENLQMIIQNFTGEGTYELSFLNIGTYSYLPDPSNPDPNTVVVYSTVGDAQTINGELNVSSYDGNTVKGTFSFTGINLNDPADTVSVTNGQFNIEVTQN
ncbi:hypothetical protein [Constantimarinum furrinae]|uniref:DUF4382 domain-containing protein n=1 Tax=Constantimarinum furrinae TaxID=2562285 RepID=A0A7G8PRM6_9FLAO|nr:hypothetical protein [Constantimarinum furrinae]QNJ96992.1 hypothetical protein ALE3EI_0406 [Constantimarinum furrinae]